MKKYLLLAITALAVIFAACNSSSSKTSGDSASNEQIEVTTQENEGEHVVLAVEGSCGMCKESIEKIAKGVDGVSSASYDLESKELHLSFNSLKTSVAAVSKLIANAGYATDLDEANQEAYEALPGCCKYKDL
ncbi:MAG: copper chaperone [Porphyromonadaceae bacterium]|nr:copper chaperone [Porphyromonadaceae bacterium]